MMTRSSFRCGIAGALFLALAAPVAAVDVASLAERSGLTERQVRMVLGAPTSYLEYRASYVRAHRALEALVGRAALRELVDEFQIEPDYTFEVLVDGEPLEPGEVREPPATGGDRKASLRSIEKGDAHH